MANEDDAPPSAFSAKRAVAPTRAATGRTKDTSDNHPSRSQTLPPTSSAARVARPPKVPEKGNTLVASGYDIEELSDSALQREGANSSQYLSPPMPVPDARHSGSSFQTEPSSYYSADDNISSAGPPPPMPVPNPARKDTVERLYDSLWEAAQSSTTPPADGSAPPMPSPYIGQESQGNNESQQDYPTSFYNPDQHWAPHQPLGMPNNDLQRDIQSYTMPSATPGMPHANISTSSAAGSSQTFDESYDGFQEPEHGQSGAAVPVMPIAPLRVQHGAKPAPMAVASTTLSQPASASARPGHPVGQKPPASGIPAQPRPFGPTPQFNAFHSPAATSTRPEAHPTATSTAAGGITPTQSPPTQSTTAAPGKASLGEHTPFFYDPVQQRWVPKKVNTPQPSRIESQQPGHPPPGAAASAFSSSFSPRPTGSQSNTRPQAGTSDPTRPHAQETSNPTKPTSRPPAVVSVSPQPQNFFSTASKPTSATNSYTQQANVRPQNVNSLAGKTGTAPTPQSPPAVRPQQNAPTKTNVTVHPPQQEITRPQNGAASGPAKTNNVAASQSTIRPQVAQTSRPQATHTQVTPAPVAAPKPQQQPSSSHLSAHKPEPTPAPASLKPDPSPPAAPAKPAKMTGAVPTRRHGQLSQFDTQYVNMLLALDDIPAIHNIAAGFFNWILLAGFILFPGTFASLQNLDVPADQLSAKLIHTITNLPL